MTTSLYLSPFWASKVALKSDASLAGRRPFAEASLGMLAVPPFSGLGRVDLGDCVLQRLRLSRSRGAAFWISCESTFPACGCRSLRRAVATVVVVLNGALGAWR